MMSQFSRILSLGAICFVYGCAGQHVLQVEPDGKTMVSRYGVEQVAARNHDRVGCIEANFSTQEEKVTAIEDRIKSLEDGLQAMQERKQQESSVEDMPETENEKKMKAYRDAHRALQ